MANNDFENVKEQADLRQYIEAHLEKRGRYHICPACGSGTHKNGTPAFSISPNGKRCKCFSCGKSWDVFDLAGELTGNTDKRAELEEVAAFFNVPLEGKPVTSKPRTSPQPVSTPQAPVKDYSEGIKAHAAYIKLTADAMKGSEGEAYLVERGFTPLEVERYGLGYDAERRRVVIPFPSPQGVYYHVDRDITGNASHKYSKPKGEEVGTQPFYNPEALSAEVLFICEGALDALAIQVSGYEAVALCSTSNHASLNKIISKHYKGVCCVLMDNDNAGKQAAASICAELKNGGIAAVNATEAWTAKEKDSAELMRSNRDNLRAFLLQVATQATENQHAEAEERYNAAMSSMRAIDPTEAVANIWLLEGFKDPISTGFQSVDAVLGGGLRSGVTVLGAISSLGKTTLAVQIADNIAASGKPVLFVTIEQSAEEIAAKSLSRYMREVGGIPLGVVNTASLMSAQERNRWGEERNKILFEACNLYTSNVAPHMRIFEGIKQPSVEDIKAVAESMANHDGEAPVIFIDYLQLLAAQDEHDTDKQTTDKNVMSLRQLARDLNTPVFVISSLNRSSYSGSISMESFKESGAIEYGSDVLLGLQPRGIEEQLADVSESKQRSKAAEILRENKGSSERECELKVLKQRAGAVPREGVPLNFIPVSSLFTEPQGSNSSRVYL